MVGIAALLDAAGRDPGRLELDLPEGWTQGRTAYGGLSAAIAYRAARSVQPDLPPLRAAQIAFVGPVSGALFAQATLLRRGRTSAFVRADLFNGDAVALSATFLFMDERASEVQFDAPAMPEVPAPEDAAPAMRDGAPAFTERLDYGHGLPFSERGHPELLRWVRLRDRDGLDAATEMLLVGDALPPGATPLMPRPAPISSANWTVNLLTPAPATTDGWWLLQSRAEHAAGGVSSQAMRVWNRAGAGVMTGSQTVSIFG
ncbi:thioesterase family protein [Sphingomonas sanxanigenens]|uniref:Acyl-CoA thioesterase n=1 Tax=Sphingomonas sanxanigenens DSM 19645 = NX02 TaxID=1123269 RepID=W0AGW0_9SPHN|nr:thioesterase family protein [Sphingomonas sanxanigenens]AHE55498.1 hypothetical protein NX02_19170 [Sphingomonas sanxanigenens DSM 19645 = NX02]